jgi:hypothetical protein
MTVGLTPPGDRVVVAPKPKDATTSSRESDLLAIVTTAKNGK